MQTRSSHHRLMPLLAASALLVAPLASHAFSGITDTTGDFLSSFAGSSASTDLDVVSATVTYNAGTDLFTLTSTMDGAIGTTASGLYVWGVNRGAGTAAFAAQGITGVRFDSVVLLFPNGTGAIGGGSSLPAGAVTISGNTISATVSGTLLPSTGFAKLDYTWNLWPRDLRYTGLAQISDFAPDNANFTATAVPEPASVALMFCGLLALAGVARRRHKA